GLSEDNKAKQLNRDFYRYIFSRHHSKIGKAIRFAMREFGGSQPDAYLFRIYNLLGDPGLRVHIVSF
ncbi:MAG: C25 family cysteine peptidase, partial [Verrucomicrobiota bacterium]